MALVAGLFVSSAILAGCTLPSQTAEPAPPDSLTPISDSITGLTPTHTRGHPSALHVSPDGAAFVAMPGTIARPGDRVVVIDLDNGARIDSIKVGRRPLALVADPLQPERLLVTHPYTNAITVIDTERRMAVQHIPAPFYLEHAAFSPDGETLVATDRALDRLVVYAVTRGEHGYELERTRSIPTGPNPEHVVFVTGTSSDTQPAGDTLVAVSNRHGASIEIADIATGDHRRLPVGGPPLALAAADGLLFVAGLGPGTGGNETNDGTPETGTADIENSLLVVDLRGGQAVLAPGASTPASASPSASTPAMLRYVSDTARPDGWPSEKRILAGATPRALTLDNGTLWVAYHGSDQVQRLHYTAPDTDAGLTAGLLTTTSGTTGTRLSHLDATTPLTPGRLGDTVHGVYETPPGPRATLRHGDLLISVAELSEQLQVIDLTDCPGPGAPTAACTHAVIDLAADPVPYPTGTFEEGERLFVSALPSADQDRSCASCHMDGLSTAQTWTLPHRPDTALLIPRLDQGPANAPWLLDGSVTTPGAYTNAAGGDMLRPDPDDPWNLEPGTDTPAPRGDNGTDNGTRSDAATDTEPDTEPDTATAAPSDAFTRRASALVANVTTPTHWFERTFAYALGEHRLLPVPPSYKDQAKENPQAADKLTGTTGCLSCHMPDGARLISGDAATHIPRPAGTDAMKARPLLGLWDRNGTSYMHNGSADSIQSTLLVEGHQCLGGADGQPTSWHSRIDEYRCSEIQATIDHILAYQPKR